VLSEAAGFAVLAAISPTELLVAAVYLGSGRPRATLLCYLAGALLMSSVVGVLILVALRSGHLELGRERQPRYGLRLGLGILALGAAAALTRRATHSADPSQSKSVVSRLIANPAPVTAFLTGLLLFGPSLTFIAAVQVIGTAQASDALTALGLGVVIVIDVMVVWLSFLAYLVAPAQTTRRLSLFNTWLRANGRVITVVVLTVAGVLLAVNGLLGVLQRS
jgi:Sap, sulfolipid-1-addressing protein